MSDEQPEESPLDVVGRFDHRSVLIGMAEALSFLSLAMVRADVIKPEAIVSAMERLVAHQRQITPQPDHEARNFAAGWVHMSMLGLMNKNATKQ